MKTLTLDLEYCYGIKKLGASFDFSTKNACAIYAPNGSMKSSLARTFQDIAEGVPSRDRVFPSRLTKRQVTTETGAELPKADVLVVQPYDEVLGHTEKTSTLLVNPALRKEYEQLHAEINAAKELFLRGMKEQSRSKKDVEREIANAFTSDGQFFRALVRVREELTAQKDAPFADIPYDVVFDDKVVAFLETKDFKVAIEDYVKKYNELLTASTYFKKGTFNYYNASTIARQLADNGFFEAKHSVTLNADEKREIASQKELEDLIAAEKDSISKDKDLKKKFAEIDKQIQKNISMRDFEAYISTHEEVLSKLANIASFKEEVWKSYMKAHFDQYSDLLTKFQAAEVRKRQIEEQAAKERTQWEEVIDIFNDRFFVPFKLKAVNRVSVILGTEPILTLGFTFEDGSDRADVQRADLLQVLSTGEKKALYVLNILFEVEVRRRVAQETLLVVDDIADSFDYKNKYAIVQYLMDIGEMDNFYLMLLTHNFDFYRTVNSRFVSYSQCFMAMKGANGVILKSAEGIQNVFINDWKLHFFTDPKKQVASIPFIRNLIEFTKDVADLDYMRLTSLLHWKADSAKITVGELDAIFNSLFGKTGASPDPKKSVMDVIETAAESCLKAPEGINFENKIVLAIAIRLAAERYMVKKINDDAFVASITSNQTPKLLKRFRNDFPTEIAALAIIQKVMLMTPENIHVNSFMYEPILDMADDHLRKLYGEVIDLS